METRVLQDIIDEGFEAVAEFLGFKSDLLATVRERIMDGVTGKGPLDPEDAMVLRWLAKEWGERLVLLRDHSAPSYDAASEPVTRLVALVRLALTVRGEREVHPLQETRSPQHTHRDPPPLEGPSRT